MTTPYFSAITPVPSPHEPLSGDIFCDVLVIGGGISGILLCELLSRSRVNVVLVEAGKLLSGQTCGTTAKITLQHGLFAERMIRQAGFSRAQGYVQANAEAGRALCTLCEQNGAECALHRTASYVYTQGSPRPIDREAEACMRLCLPIHVTRRLPAPLLPAAAIRMDAQAQFNPLPLLYALSTHFPCYEHTQVLALEGTCAHTAHGRIRAETIVLCTHYPAFSPLYAMRLHQQRALTLALRTRHTVDGMLYGIDGPSLRSAPGAVFLGGASSRSGGQSGSGYAQLRMEAARLFPDAQEIAHWSAQDCITPDGIPYVGRLSRFSPAVYVATGFGKWGMTNAMAAAMLLHDEILGMCSPYAPVFSPQRVPSLRAAGSMLAQGLQGCRGLGESLLCPGLRTTDTMQNGEAGIVSEGMHRVAAYRDPQGALHRCTPYCAHMKCLLHFNADDTSWDCPCHGSRFTVDGERICGPAQKGCIPHTCPKSRRL